MKRYWLFAYYGYYPSGPRGDFADDFDSLEEIQERLDKKWYRSDNYEILDLDERKWIDVYNNKVQIGG